MCVCDVVVVVVVVVIMIPPNTLTPQDATLEDDHLNEYYTTTL